MTLRFPFSICSPLPPFLASSLRRRFSASSPPADGAALSFTPPPTSASAEHLNPLFLRPLSFAASRSDLLDFRRWAESLALAAGPRLSSDGGPGEDLLRRELAWMLEDAAADPGVGAVRLRVELEELYRLWRERIEERRPLQYIVGCEHWRDLVLVVNEGVLIPRPETEMVVDLVAEVDGFEHGLWADLGTGSGAISVGIGRMLREGGRVFATDLSPIALEIARLNVERYGLKVRSHGRTIFIPQVCVWFFYQLLLGLFAGNLCHFRFLSIHDFVILLLLPPSPTSCIWAWNICNLNRK